MKRVMRYVLSGGVIWFLILVINTVAIAQTGECTRENLQTITDKFFTALEAHNTSSVPLASNVRYTENGLEVPVGKGVWVTAMKTTFKRGMVDKQKCGTIPRPYWMK